MLSYLLLVKFVQYGTLLNYLYCNKYAEGVINLENFSNSSKGVILVA